MLCLIGVIFMISMTSLQACPDPMAVHIQHFDGSIILHSENCDQQPRYHSNQNTQHNCDTECGCVTRQNYSPYPVTTYPATCYCCYPVYGGSTPYSATNSGSNGCYPSQGGKPVFCGSLDRGYSMCQ